MQKIIADITGRPLISGLTVITIGVASALLTLALATLLNLSAPYDRSFEELNGAHLWLYFDRDRTSAHDVEQVEALPGVVASTGLQYSIQTRARIGGARTWVSLRVMPAQMPAVNRLLIQGGRYLSSRPDEVLASKDLADLRQLATGDSVGITRADGREVNLPVIGLAYNPTWDTYRNDQPPYLYVTEATMRDLFPDEATWDWSVGLRLADAQSVDQVLKEANTLLRSGAVDSHTDWRNVRDSAIFNAQMNFVFLGAFSFFAVLATVLVIASSIGSLVLSQFRQIGILKAIGFTKNQIMALYLGQYVVLSLIASPLGLLLGIALSPLPLKSVAVSLSTTFQPPFNWLLIGLVLSIIPGIVILSTLGAAYRGAKANIIRAIAVGAEAPHRKPFWGTRFAAWLGLPMPLVLGLNDVFAKPFRSALTGLNLTLGVIGIVFGLALNETIKTYETDPTLMGVVFDAIVTRNETDDAQTQRLLRRAPGVEAFYAQYQLDVKTQQGQSFKVKAIEGNLAVFPFRISEGKFFEPNTNEAIAGQGLLNWLGLRVGDTITLIWDDKADRPITWRIVGRYSEPSNAGQMLMVSLPSITRWKRFEPDAYFLKLRADCNPAQLKRYLEPKPDSDLSLTLLNRAIPSDVLYLQLAIFALSGILIGIALINVFNTSLLAVQEKLRMVGVLKTLGMTPAQVVTMVNTTAGFLGLLAAGIGIPLGLTFTRVLLATLSDVYGFGEVTVTINSLYAALLIPLMVVVSMAGSFMPGRWAARLSIVSVLQSE